MVEQPPERLSIEWAPAAREEWKNILVFFADRNGSIEYSLKLDDRLMNLLEKLSLHPEMGEQTDIENTRSHVLVNYAVYYRINDRKLEIMAIRDARIESED